MLRCVEFFLLPPVVDLSLSLCAIVFAHVSQCSFCLPVCLNRSLDGVCVCNTTHPHIQFYTNIPFAFRFRSALSAMASNRPVMSLSLGGHIAANNPMRPGQRFQYGSTGANVVDLSVAPATATAAQPAPAATPGAGPSWRPTRATPTAPSPKTPTPAGPRLSDATASQILPFLWLGSLTDAENGPFLAASGATDVVNVSALPSVAASVAGAPAALRRHDVPAHDNASFAIDAVFERCFAVFDAVRARWCAAAEAAAAAVAAASSLPSDGDGDGDGVVGGDGVGGGSGRGVASQPPGPCVLVHCEKGISRSPTVVIAYLVARNGWSVVEAFKFAQERRPCVEPNAGFMERLRRFEQMPETVAARPRLRRALLVAVRNVRPDAAEGAVKAFFEASVGAVWHVTRMEPAVDAAAHAGAKGDAAAQQQQQQQQQHHQQQGASSPPVRLCLVFFAMAELCRAAVARNAAGPEHNPLATDGRRLLMAMAAPAATAAAGGGSGGASGDAKRRSVTNRGPARAPTGAGGAASAASAAGARRRRRLGGDSDSADSADADANDASGSGSGGVSPPPAPDAARPSQSSRRSCAGRTPSPCEAAGGQSPASSTGDSPSSASLTAAIGACLSATPPKVRARHSFQ